ncbi:MAG: 3-deoxy-D-manno-octulosonic acid transferase [Pseudorhodoplanes sp.]|uniref:3-deoxy-D-manno-octulosonic acid transferase n=1 Tax=Pseudorhodoplanes sp. TaxID=1934341 RepID=UPI003D0AD0B6
MAERLPMTLRAYRRAMSAAEPLANLWLKRRLRRGKEIKERLAERHGEPGLDRPAGPLVWLHGASVGEITSVFPLIEQLRMQDVNLLVTSGTVTSAKVVKDRLPEDVIHQFIPLDAPRFVTRFLHHWRPDLGLFIEQDLWPNLILAAARRRIPLVLINGRMSEQSFKGWHSLRRTAKALLGKFDLCLAQSALDAERFAQLGMPSVQITGNLKLDVPAPPADEIKLAEMQRAAADRQVLVAASTHPGEDDAVIEAHRRARKGRPRLLTIIAPRHPERGPDILNRAVASGSRAMLRSRGVTPDVRTDIYIADTMGELGLFYRLAHVVFMGGSIVEHGGQNPIEAAKLGKPILHGPNVWNFHDIYAALDAARGAEEVENIGHLAMRVSDLMKDPAARKAAGDAAFRTVERLGGALERTFAELEPYLMQLRLSHQASDA